VDASAPNEVEVELKPTVKYGKISMHIEPQPGWANVYLRGKWVGKVPKKNLRLPVGKHRLRLHNPHSGKEKSVDVVVLENEVKYYKVQF
jgi:hypothetical protein